MITKQAAQNNVTEFKNSQVNKNNEQLIREVDNIIVDLSKKGKSSTKIVSLVLFPQAVIDEIRAAGFNIERDKEDVITYTYFIKWD